MNEIILLGYGIYQTKAGVTKYAISFKTSEKDSKSHIVEGDESNVCDVDQKTYSRLAAHKIGDKVKVVLHRNGYYPFPWEIISCPSKEDFA